MSHDDVAIDSAMRQWLNKHGFPLPVSFGLPICLAPLSRLPSAEVKS